MTTPGSDYFEVVSPRGRSVHPVTDAGGHSRTGVAYEPRQIVFRGTYGELYDHFEREMWTDGLPFVPPTLRAVEEMVARSRRDPGAVIGVVGDEGIEATVWNTAVNGLMAGCRPDHLPLLVATVECLADPSFHVGHAGSTTGWEILVIVSGPDLPERGFNCSTGVMRVGVRANSTVGRFTRLWLRNVAGLHIPPGFTDMAGLGQSFLVAMAEDDSATRALGWAPCRVEWGLRDDDMAVGVQGVLAVSGPIYSSGARPEDHLGMIAEQVAACSAHLAGLGAVHGLWRPLLAVSPAVAEVLARHGMTKVDVRDALMERAVAPARWLERAAEAALMRPVDLGGLAAAGRLSERFRASDAAERPVPVMLTASDLEIVVTGNPGRNQSKYYIPTPLAGARLVRRVDPVAGPADG